MPQKALIRPFSSRVTLPDFATLHRRGRCKHSCKKSIVSLLTSVKVPQRFGPTLNSTNSSFAVGTSLATLVKAGATSLCRIKTCFVACAVDNAALEAGFGGIFASLLIPKEIETTFKGHVLR